VEGHARGRAAIADKKRREREGGEGAAAAVAQDDYGPRSAARVVERVVDWTRHQSADEGTLEVLSFEAVELDDSIDIPHPLPSSDLPPAPCVPIPIHLPALKTANSIPGYLVMAPQRRNWHMPALRVLTIGELPGGDAGSVWLTHCKAIEVLDFNATGSYSGAFVADLPSALPAGCGALEALHTLRGIALPASPADIDKLREVMVARGARRSIRNLQFIWNHCVVDTDNTVQQLRKIAELRDAVADPAAMSEPLVCGNMGYGGLAMELLSRSSDHVFQNVIAVFAKTITTVTYCGRTEATPASITDDTFPAAHTLQLQDDALPSEAKKKRAVEIASHMANLQRIEADAHVAVSEVWRFVARLQRARIGRGREGGLTVHLMVNFYTLLGHVPACFCLGGRSVEQLRGVEKIEIDIWGDVEELGEEFEVGDEFDTFYGNVMAMVTAYNEIKGHTATRVSIAEHGLRYRFQERFHQQHAALKLAGGPFRFCCDDQGFLVERRA